MEQMYIAIAVFVVAYVFIVSEKIAAAVIAMVGSFVLIATNVMNQEQAIHFIDFNTLGLLAGMMIMVSILRKTGIFEYVAIKAVKMAGGDPWRVLVSLSVITAVLSSLLDNVTTVLIIVPVTFAIADAINLNPMPFLISEILFSNIGGTATLIGDPPNIMIGGATNLGFMEFIYNNAPIVAIASVFVLFCLKQIYHKDLQLLEDTSEKLKAFDETRAIRDGKFLKRSLFIFAITVMGFMTHSFFHLDLATVALGGGFALLMVSGLDPEEILREIEWPTIFFFTGLFILVGGLEKTYVILSIAQKLIEWTGGILSTTTMFILWSSALFSSFVDNVPYTATMISVIKSIGKASTFDIKPLWWALSLGACFGGNGTMVGAAANIIVVGFSKRSGHPIRFGDYLKIGFPLMIGTIALSSVYLYLRFFI